MAIPSGKGIFTWHLYETAGGSPKLLAASAVAAGFDEVYVKIVDGDWAYPAEPILATLDALEAVSVRAHAWLYTYGVRKLVDIAAREADRAAERFLFYNRAGPRFGSLVVDAEAEYERAGGARRARTFSTRLRANLPDVEIGLASYRFPTQHGAFPWAEMTRPEVCDFHMPQVYWAMAHNPGRQLARSVQELEAVRQLPIVPIGSAYHEGKWEGPTVEELDEMDAEARALDLPGIAWWSFQAAEGHQDWWAALGRHDWKADPPPPPMTLEQRLAALEHRVENIEGFLVI